MDHYLIKWPKLLKGTLIKRYKRFITEVKLRNGHTVKALCPNTGTMLTCSEPGRPVYISKHNIPSRKLKYTWEMIDMPESLVGVNTGVPNHLVKEAIVSGLIKELTGYGSIRSEVKYGTNSRIDLLLENDGDRCYVEIKNCTLAENGIACFPDAVTSRGLKHLKELQAQIQQGDRAAMFYLVQRMDAGLFKPADHIDPEYGKELRKAVKNGVEIMVYDVHIDLQGIGINKALPYDLS